MQMGPARLLTLTKKLTDAQLALCRTAVRRSRGCSVNSPEYSAEKTRIQEMQPKRATLRARFNTPSSPSCNLHPRPSLSNSTQLSQHCPVTFPPSTPPPTLLLAIASSASLAKRLQLIPALRNRLHPCP